MARTADSGTREAARRALAGTGATVLLFVAGYVWFFAINAMTGSPALALGLAALIAFAGGMLAARR